MKAFFWVCSQCGTRNSIIYYTCGQCGKIRNSEDQKVSEGEEQEKR